ncbi:MAG: enoyl-CoA hydratase/isomerase family protein [Sphingomicrobium sp.]
MTSNETTETRNYVEGRAGRLRLNRPKALNALTLPMVRQLTSALLLWRSDPTVRLILLDHAMGRGFCAGGDVVSIAKSAQGHGAAAEEFFFEEYRLNHLMYTFPKPGVAFMDGVTMGGGVGLACPCRYRIATERTVFAMPETSIGLFPDVGGGRYLSRLRGRMAQYLALTGARLDGAECIALGLASHYIESDALDAVKEQLCTHPEKVESILAGATSPSPEAKIVRHLKAIDRLFASDVYEEILAALRVDGSEWASEQLEVLASKSPTACKVSLRMLVESPRHLHFVDEMKMEFGIVARSCRSHDFAEGVRALLIDKDRQPKWQPSSPEGVTQEIVDRYFEPLPEERTWTPLTRVD